jgi:hypothetical protein
MRSDLTEGEIRELLRRSERVSRAMDVWDPTSAERLKILVGELYRLRDREANVMQMHQIEGVY